MCENVKLIWNQKAYKGNQHWIDFVNWSVTTITGRFRECHIKSSLTWFGYTLLHLYETIDIQEFFNKTIHIVFENERFSKGLQYTLINICKWTHPVTPVKYLHIMRYILYTKDQTSIYFAQSLQLISIAQQLKQEYDDIIPRKYHKHKQRLHFHAWIETFLLKTTNKSRQGLKNIMFFLLRSCSLLNVSFEWFDDISYGWISFFQTIQKEQWHKVFVSQNYKQKQSWFTVFLNYCLHIDANKIVCLFESELDSIHRTFCLKRKKEIQEDFDKHLISNADLDKLYNATLYCDYREQVCFLLLISTGIRVSALTKIELKHICSHDTKTNELIIFNQSKTIEKGSKRFSFSLMPRLQYLIKMYIQEERKTNSIYLFPGKGSGVRLSPNRIQTMLNHWCTLAELSGPQFHVHSLRHSYAHILQQSGNSCEIISKLMGHDDVSTTKHYYLKETANDIVQRANIPWIPTSNQPVTIPTFLQAQEITPVIKKQRLSDISMLL